MLELLDSGRMAHKFGKWRGAVTLVFGLLPLVLAWFVVSLFDLTTSLGPKTASAGMPAPMMWLALGLLGVAAVTFIYGLWLLFVDETRGDYIELAHRYKRDGW